MSLLLCAAFVASRTSSEVSMSPLRGILMRKLGYLGTLIASIPTRVVGCEPWPTHDTGHVVLRHRSLELMVFRRPEIVTG